MRKGAASSRPGCVIAGDDAGAVKTTVVSIPGVRPQPRDLIVGGRHLHGLRHERGKYLCVPDPVEICRRGVHAIGTYVEHERQRLRGCRIPYVYRTVAGLEPHQTTTSRRD